MRWLGQVARHPGQVLSLYAGLHRWSERTIIAVVMQTHDNSLTLFPRRTRLGQVKLSSRQGHGLPNPTWIPAANEALPAAPDRLWVADLTYVRTFAGWVYVAFVVDVFSRRIVGWQLATHLRTSLALDALEMAIWTRKRDPHSDLSALIHHSDRGGQYLSIRYSERLAEEGAVTSVGSRGDSYDNALAETVNGLFKTELVRRRGPWRGLDDLELATLEWVDWWNHRRLHQALGHVPPTEHETNHYRQQPAPAGR